MVHSQHLCIWKSNHFLQIQNKIDFRLQPDKLCAFPKLHFCRILAYCDVENNIKFIIAPQHKLCSRYNVYFLLKLLKFRAVVLQQTTFFFQIHSSSRIWPHFVFVRSSMRIAHKNAMFCWCVKFDLKKWSKIIWGPAIMPPW